MDMFNSVEDNSPVHILDLIKCWPSGMNPSDLEPLNGYKWKYHTGNTWSIVDINGDCEYFEGHWLNYHENKKKYAQRAPHIFDLIDNWPDQRNLRPGLEAPEGWEWEYFGDGWILINGIVVLKREDWLRYHDETIGTPAKVAITAASMLQSALGHMEDRAKTYDAPGGERSMGKTVAAFNIITGNNLTEEAGWLFMILLKSVRAQTDKTLDSLEDMVAYAALRGECAARERGDK